MKSTPMSANQFIGAIAVGIVCALLSCGPSCPSPDTPEVRLSADAKCDGGQAGRGGGGEFPDASTFPATSCGRAWENLTTLKCEEARNTPGGTTFLQWCENTESTGYVTVNPECLSRITDCKQVNSCSQHKKN